MDNQQIMSLLGNSGFNPFALGRFPDFGRRAIRGLPNNSSIQQIRQNLPPLPPSLPQLPPAINSLLGGSGGGSLPPGIQLPPNLPPLPPLPPRQFGPQPISPPINRR